LAPAILQLLLQNLCSGRLSLCVVDCSECSGHGRADLAAGRAMNARFADRR